MSLLTGQPTSWEKRDSPMADTERYWNPVLETLPAARLRELQFRKFKRIVSWAYERSPSYRSVYDESGFRPDMLQTFADIPRVPKVETVSYTHLRAHETKANLVCRLLLEKK